MSIYFTKITPENWRTINKLKVKEHQQNFVASNLVILARAFAYREHNSYVHAIYKEKFPIGLLMQYDYKQDNKLVCILSQFMIADKYQGIGYGKAAMKLWISMIKKEEKYEYITICYIKGDKVAEKLYLNIGFYHTGEIDGDEVIMRYDLI